MYGMFVVYVCMLCMYVAYVGSVRKCVALSMCLCDMLLCLSVAYVCVWVNI